MIHGQDISVVWIIIIVAIIILALILVLNFFTSSNRTKAESGREEDTPLEILKKRYAKGDISKEEFEEMKQDLLEW